MGTHAKPNADGVVARKIDDGDPLGLWPNGADMGVVDEVDNKSEPLEGGVFEETTIP